MAVLGAWSFGLGALDLELGAWSLAVLGAAALGIGGCYAIYRLLTSGSRPLFETQQRLGKGAFGEVWKVKYHDGRILAAKLILCEGKNVTLIKKELHSEINLYKLHHPNVLKFVNISIVEQRVTIFTELIQGKSLADVVRKKELTTEPWIKCFSKQICTGLSYLHHNGVIHRDIKGSNIMVSSKDDVVKLIDFGLSLQIELSAGQNYRAAYHETYTHCGTICYMAPELLQCDSKPNYTPMSDVWAFGCTVYEIVTGGAPYHGRHDCVNLIVREGAPELPDGCTSELRNFYQACVKRNARDRPTAGQLLEMPFLQ